MKNQFFFLIALVLLGITSSCKKETTNTNTNNTNTTTATFSWTENGGSALTADSAKWTTGAWGTGIRAWKASGSYFFEINWDTTNNTSIGTKVLNVPYGFTMLKSGSSTSGYVNTAVAYLSITGSNNDKISGNFSLPAVDGANTLTINGTFSNIPKE
jgi:hypothetical protein